MQGFETAKARIAGELSRYKMPKGIGMVAGMPRTTLGKIRKMLLQTRSATRFAIDTAARP